MFYIPPNKLLNTKLLVRRKFPIATRSKKGDHAILFPLLNTPNPFSRYNAQVIPRRCGRGSFLSVQEGDRPQCRLLMTSLTEMTGPICGPRLSPAQGSSVQGREGGTTWRGTRYSLSRTLSPATLFIAPTRPVTPRAALLALVIVKSTQWSVWPLSGGRMYIRVGSCHEAYRVSTSFPS